MGAIERAVAGLLDEWAEAVAELQRGRPDVRCPQLVLASSLVLVSAASFSRGYLVPLLVTALSLPLLRGRFGAFIRAAAPALTLALGPALVGAWTDPGALAAVVARCAASLAAGAAYLGLLGHRGLAAALAGLGMGALADAVSVAMVRVPVALRDLARLLIAREARDLSGGLRGAWSALAGAVGECLARGARRGWVLGLAMEARDLGGRRRAGTGWALGPIELYSLVSCLAAVVLLGRA